MIATGQPAQRLRVLQLSYACSPVRGSEAGVGWQRALHSAEQFDTWVICEQHEFASEVHDYLAKHGPLPGLHFVFVPINQREWSLGQYHDCLWYWALRRWHRQALNKARQLHASLHFDLVHQVTFCGYREPGLLWQLDAPFVWGPIGGAQDYPRRFLRHAGPRATLAESLRSLINRFQLRWSRRVRQAASRATALIAANSENRECFAKAWGKTLSSFPDVGIRSVADSVKVIRPGPIRLLWSGLLTHRKALHLLLEALAQIPSDVVYELRVLGEGRSKRRWQQLSSKLGVADHVNWLGWLPHVEAIQQYHWADAFVFSSLRDTTGTVIVEAMAAGLPVICLDHQGAHDVVTADCGIKIPVTTPEQAVTDMAAAIVRLARDPDERVRLGRGAVARAREYLWDRHKTWLLDLYWQILCSNRAGFPAVRLVGPNADCKRQTRGMARNGEPCTKRTPTGEV